MKLSNGIFNMTNTAINTAVVGISSVFLLISTASLADDIDLYTSDSITENQTRPKVLLIFDNSGSMNGDDDYKPAFADYSYSSSGSDDDYIYYAKGDSASVIPVLGSSEDRRFLKTINGCNTAKVSLETYGIYTGRVREYTYLGNSGSWEDIPEFTGEDIRVIDCEDDVLLSQPNNNDTKWKPSTASNATTNLPNPQSGYPIDGQGSIDAPQFHTSNAAESNVRWSGTYVTLYSAKYLSWYHNDSLAEVERSRLEVARESVTTLINTTPNIDFGLMVFNDNRVPYIGDVTLPVNDDGAIFTNHLHHGGRVVRGIETTSVDSRDELLNIINNQIGADTATPLCETLYEASRYFGGLSVDLGNQDLEGGDFTGDYRQDNGNFRGRAYPGLPLRDDSADVEVGGVYVSPFNACSDKAYIIYLTDGKPWFDEEITDTIIARTAGENVITADDQYRYLPAGASWWENTTTAYSYLPALAGWMNENDVNPNIEGKQTVSTYTIGFSSGAEEAEDLLERTALLGGGEYYFANNSANLTTALTNVLSDLTPASQTITSASVAANNFDRTQTLDSIYYAMFEPSSGPRWSGNIKKYKIKDGTQEGANSVAAINSGTGHFSSNVQSYWSSDVDGNDVSAGGAAEMLRGKTSRIIKSDLGAGYALKDLTYTEAKGSTAFPTQQQLATALKVDNTQSKIEDSLAWINGIDVDNQDDDDNWQATDIRSDVFGDPIHSQPVVINYGNGNVYLAVGTNHGVLHFLKDTDNTNTIDEKWAFMPKEFLGNVEELRNNISGDPKTYGIDGSITKYFYDKNGDGIVDTSDGDYVWLFFGYRRGGSSYYALDVSNPTIDPIVKWKISGGDTGFTELGETWSKPKVIFTKLNASDTVAKPTLIFGGGYDNNNDDDAVGAVDNVGRAIYMVDADLGTPVWTLSPQNGNTTFPGTDSIPGSIATLDSDSDGFVDRLYAGDTGGNIWRVDIPGDTTTDISVFKLAELGHETLDLEDRRFFNEPAIVRTYISETLNIGTAGTPKIVQQETPYDAILIGSGDRTSPMDTATGDTLFMIKDSNISTQQFSDINTDLEDIPDTIVIGDLYNYTNNPFKDFTGTTADTALIDNLPYQVSLKSGWFIDLKQAGEKSTARSVVINNVAYFTTYTPPDGSVASSTSCTLPSGQGWLYAVDLALGIKRFDWAAEDSRNREDRISFISEQFLGAPTIVVIPVTDGDGNTELDGNLIVGREMIDADFTPQTMRTYLYVTED